jgi:pyrimidine-nucleoside phosphorylase
MDDGWLRRAIEVKRDGGALDDATWSRIIATYVAGEIDDAPIAALAMACAIRGMADAEIIALTHAMIRSGDVLEIPGRMAVDKHSSGGVGDVVSLIVVPIVAACGVPVAKLSGRALGHTGGTLDKLEAIPGVRTDLSPHDFVAQVGRVGCAIAAQSERLVPADRKLYALRDRTGTVPSIGLIAASIVSKKIASGAGAIVYDVKVGGGAFMRTREDALALAELLVRLTHGCGKRASALVTDMDEPLAANIGTGAEAIEARDFLRGSARDARLAQLATIVAHEMLRVGGVPEDEIATRHEGAISSGAAYEKFIEMLEAQGGSRRRVESMELVRERSVISASRSGIVGAIDSVAIGEAARGLVAAGGPFAGIRIVARVGTQVGRGDELAYVFGPASAIDGVAAAFSIGKTTPVVRPLVEAVVRDAGARSTSKVLEV